MRAIVRFGWAAALFGLLAACEEEEPAKSAVTATVAGPVPPAPVRPSDPGEEPPSVAKPRAAMDDGGPSQASDAQASEGGAGDLVFAGVVRADAASITVIGSAPSGLKMGANGQIEAADYVEVKNELPAEAGQSFLWIRLARKDTSHDGVLEVKDLHVQCADGRREPLAFTRDVRRGPFRAVEISFTGAITGTSRATSIAAPAGDLETFVLFRVPSGGKGCKFMHGARSSTFDHP